MLPPDEPRVAPPEDDLLGAGAGGGDETGAERLTLPPIEPPDERELPPDDREMPDDGRAVEPDDLTGADRGALTTGALVGGDALRVDPIVGPIELRAVLGAEAMPDDRVTGAERATGTGVAFLSPEFRNTFAGDVA